MVVPGLSGLFSTDLRLRKVELRDPKDLYAATSPGGHGFWCHELLADQLTADGIHILR